MEFNLEKFYKKILELRIFLSLVILLLIRFVLL